MKTTHISITQAGIIAGLTTVIGQVVALVPSWSPNKSILIQLCSAIVAAAFLGANAIHHLADSASPIVAIVPTKVSTSDQISQPVITLADAQNVAPGTQVQS